MLPLFVFWKDDDKRNKLNVSILESFKELFSNKKVFYFLIAISIIGIVKAMNNI